MLILGGVAILLQQAPFAAGYATFIDALQPAAQSTVDAVPPSSTITSRTTSPATTTTYDNKTYMPTNSPTGMPVIFVPLQKGPIPNWLGVGELERLRNNLMQIECSNSTVDNKTITYQTLASCIDPIQNYIVDLINGSDTQHAYSLFNSWGVYPDSEGNYYECTSAGHMYCSMFVNKSDNTHGYNIDVCIPSTCNKTQLEVLRTLVIANFGAKSQYDFGNTVCITDNDSVAETYVIILVFVIFIFIPTLASVVDAWKTNPAEMYSDDDFQSYVSTSAIAGRRSLSINAEASLSLLSMKIKNVDEEDEQCLTFGFVEVFSIIRSWRRLMASPRYGRSMQSLDGIRVLSMLWIIAGQTLNIQMPYFRQNSRYVMSTLPSQPSFQLILNASLATDSFLLVSGLLAMYKILGQFSRRWAPRRWSAVMFVISSYFKRMGRLMPLLAITMLFYVCMLPGLVNGPMWMDWLSKSDYTSCASGWWKTLLFINNVELDKGRQLCMGWTWYLGVDVQLHLLAPGIALLFWHYGIAAIVTTVVLIVASIGSNMATVVVNNLTACPADFMDLGVEHTELMQMPYNRAVPFLLGFLVAFWFNVIGEESGARNLAPMRLWKRMLLMATSISLMAVPLFSTMGMRYTEGPEVGMCQWDDFQSFVYLTLHRASFSLGLFLLITGLLAGWAGWLLNLLCMPAWTPLARLVYGVYLLHPIVIEVLVYGGNQMPQYTTFNFITLYFAAVVLTFFFSALVFLVLEGPLFAIHNICLRGVTSSAQRR